VKEIGSGPNEQHQEAAHPQMVLFDTTGRHLLGTDLGSDRLSVFALAENKLVVRDRSATQPGSGPRHMALHPSGRLLYVMNHLDPSISCYGYDAADGRLLERLQHHALEGKTGASMITLHPSGQSLYTLQRDGIATWRVDCTTGALTATQLWSDGLPSLHSMALAPDGTAMLILNQRHDSVFQMRVDSATGKLGDASLVASLPSPMSIALKYV
jgi:6-phosphogluconolactonase (cycloisomerase 2 family)